MKIEPTDYGWRSIEAVVGEEIRVPYYRRTTTVIPTGDDPDRVTVTYLAEDPDFDPEGELYAPEGGTLERVSRIVVPRDEPVPLNHFHDEVTLYPAPDRSSLAVYFLGPVPFEWEEMHTSTGEIRTRRTERDPSR